MLITFPLDFLAFSLTKPQYTPDIHYGSCEYIYFYQDNNNTLYALPRKIIKSRSNGKKPAGALPAGLDSIFSYDR